MKRVAFVIFLFLPTFSAPLLSQTVPSDEASMVFFIGQHESIMEGGTYWIVANGQLVAEIPIGQAHVVRGLTDRVQNVVYFVANWKVLNRDAQSVLVVERFDTELGQRHYFEIIPGPLTTDLAIVPRSQREFEAAAGGTR